ncbi:protein kinase [Mycobacterium shinjukuense]|uniref:non-specific serine/threonine protein kinase n=1 Tax=Mycobacterium shinjukuense TaxID=398694 RepID=A0A7I7MQ45_9MYCO|nr:protein kinase [Mycobacterium shinjukuense]MCV6985656.1 protein kinase [Mycobacterium shinjukuense]ORB71547.1 serine/threonine protein kinase [Mycobacterium shinjukuense]BBX74358.1 serine/threonine-protein kinase PknI [Mycobacterium shinjukuense]
MALASGATFAGYPVVRMLGAGATGEVYLVQDPRSPPWAALKILTPALSADDEFRRRFHRETPIAAQLYHPHIVEVRERGEVDGRLWIATDYIDGITAAQLMRQRFPAVLPVGEALAILAAAASALDHAHRRGLLHRAVKPANILLTSIGEPRILLTDFGIAPAAGGGKGAAAYLAPEQLMGDEVDARADQYALAATVVHLLTGAAPADRSRPATLSDARPDLARLDAVFAKALAQQREHRFGSCREFADVVSARAGPGFGERSPQVVGPPTQGVTEVVDYPAYGWPDADNAERQPAAPVQSAPAKSRGTSLQSVAGLARRLADSTATVKPQRRAPRRIVVGAAGVALIVALVAVSFVIGRKTSTTSTPVAGPPTTASAAPSTPTGGAPATAPVSLDGTYRIEVQRSKQTYDYTPSPQPPDVNTWWAIRSSCTPTGCQAVATLLDDNDHTRAKSPTVRPLVLQFGDGQWTSRPETVPFPCIGPNGSASTQSTTQLLSLRPQPQGDLVGEMVVTVHSDECGQQGAVIRIPAVASRSGDLPPRVTVPDPATLPPALTEAPPTPTTTASGPGR